MATELTRSFDNWYDGLSHNAWIDDGVMEVYVRKAHHLCGALVLETIDVANVTIFDEKDRGCGLFTGFLEHVEDYQQVVYVENLLNPRLAVFFDKRGYLRVKNTGDIDWIPSFYKEFT